MSVQMVCNGYQQSAVVTLSGAWDNMGLAVRKPVFGVSDKASFKQVSSATETRQKIEISPVAS